MSKPKRQESHVRLYRHELNSAAYRSLSPDARALLIEFRALYGGDENRIFMSVREIMRRLNVSQKPAERARDQLLDRGFVRVLAFGSFKRKRRHATEYVLTNEPLETTPGVTAPKDFMRWRQKNTVADSTTDGSGIDYRDKPRKGKNPPHGSGIDYREGQNSGTHGSAIRYTDKLPPQGAETSTGYRCRNGKLLNANCIVCRVWITDDGHEFDGGRHVCDKVSKAEYRAQFSPDVRAKQSASAA